MTRNSGLAATIRNDFSPFFKRASACTDAS